MIRLILALAFMALAILMLINGFLSLEDFQAYQAAGEVSLAGQSLIGMLVCIAFAALLFVISIAIAFFWDKVNSKFQ